MANPARRKPRESNHLMAQFLDIQEPPHRNAANGFALWALGFRPFYLLASTFAALSIGIWALEFGGYMTWLYLPSSLWHAHEMLFGFALAVVVGFLLTAGRNWAGQPTLTGGRLAALALLWVAGRVLVLTPFGWAAAILNAAFPLAAAIALAIPFIKAGNRRNYFFIGLLVMLSVAELVFHLGQLDVLHIPPWAGIGIALDVVLFIVCVMAGRVVPMFTNNGVAGANATRRAWLEKAALGSVLAVLAADFLQVPREVLVAICAIAAAAHLARWWLWQPWKTLRAPLVWVLHAAYAWIPVHFALRAMAAMDWVPTSAATHALTVGAIGGMIIGMMTRTARGHTGRPLRADGYEVACYSMVLLAAIVRVGVPLAAPGLIVHAVLCSGLLWSAAFGLYAVRYWPILTRARIDGLPG
jgi:uncharacterized protein involved in response to NO